MISEKDLYDINNKIQLLKKTARELQTAGKSIPAVEKNTLRIQASIKMLEINISDVIDVAAGTETLTARPK